jgi:hypothetical protein
MSLVDLMALEASYRSDKTSYDQALDDLNYSSKKPTTKKVTEVAQRNVDLQTSLLSMSNLLPASGVEHFSMLNEVRALEDDYAKLVSDSGTIATMFKTRYIGWSVLAFVLIVTLVRQAASKNSIEVK